jgi:hypothetical protein
MSKHELSWMESFLFYTLPLLYISLKGPALYAASQVRHVHAGAARSRGRTVVHPHAPLGTTICDPAPAGQYGDVLRRPGYG